MQQAGFILKVLLVSVVLSILIKYSSLTSIPATATVALTFVFMPSLLMAIALLLRGFQSNIKRGQGSGIGGQGNPHT